MKKNFIYATLSAIALVGAVSLTSCSSNEDVADVNPTFDGEAVKTQFTISFPQNVAKTRQTAGTVQNSENLTGFRGMDNIVLYPFAATGTAGQDPVTNTLTKLGDQIALTSMIKPETSTNINNSIPASTLMANSNSVLYNDVTVPLGTGSFLFYGKAIDATGKDNFYNGKLNMVNTSAEPQDAPNPANIAFNLEPIYPSTTTESEIGAALATYLSTIAQASGWETTTNDGLKELYTKFASLKQGSSLTAQAAVQDLYSSIKNNTDAVAVAIKDAILGVISSSDPEAHYASDNGTGTLSFDTSISGFPEDKNLPDGAAFLTYDENTNTFTQSTAGSQNSGLTAPYNAYTYPASLYYYGNSGVKTATSSQATLYDGQKNWGQIIGDNAFNGNSVGPSTRSVAIIDPIQYAVGRLDMKVSGLVTTTEDAKKIMYDKKGEKYDATAGFTITGILIGGQKQVGFDFKTNTSAAQQTIYDNITKSRAGEAALTVLPREDNSNPASNESGVNYTLALETEENANNGIFVAVEFLNNGADFEGVDGVIPAGCKFYLVGELKPADVTDAGKNPGNLTQVFKQDYKTIANFSISQNTGEAHNKGLGAAYNTIPDLRTPQLELGLSVDLQWQEGITFDLEF